MELHCSLPCSQNPALIPILSQVNNVLAIPIHFYRTHFNIILPVMPTSSNWSVSYSIPCHNPLFIFILPHNISRFIVSFISFFLLSALSNVQFFFVWIGSPSGPRRLSRWGFEITHRHITLGRTPLDKGSARRRDLHLTTYNKHNRETFVPLAWCETSILARERPQTC